mmetsp:Transcript_10673/g.14365  ORF Transcript_10673/g.14365 Transcript_10673/m.14365 type:complete len:205 (-) Transcript_10673:3-617(-)
MSPIAVFQPETAQGKLKAEMMPMLPIGFHYSKIMWSGRSLGITLPPTVRDMPTAISQISMYSCTSPSPSVLILPISREIRAPKASFLVRSSSPIWRMISPRAGMGVVIQRACSDCMASTQSSKSFELPICTDAIGSLLCGLMLTCMGPRPSTHWPPRYTPGLVSPRPKVFKNGYCLSAVLVEKGRREKAVLLRNMSTRYFRSLK